MVDYYKVLGVARDATRKEIRKAYLKLAKQHHPDHNAGASASEEKFKEIHEAYQTLSDEGKRKAYDEELLHPKSGRGGGASARKPGGSSAGRGGAAGNAGRRKTGGSGGGINFDDLASGFAAFYGFDPKTGQVTDEEGMSQFAGKKKKNLLDVSDMFEKFMGFKG